MRWLRAFFDTILRLLGRRLPPVPRDPVSLKPIGVVRNNVRESRMDGWENVRSDLIFRDDLLEALDGIEQYSHIIVVFAFHRLPEDERTSGRIHPRGDPERPLQGVLATRSQRRPTGLGVSVVPLLRRRRNVLRVRGLDAIDGTPVLDIKPYYPAYDAVPDATIPRLEQTAVGGCGSCRDRSSDLSARRRRGRTRNPLGLHVILSLAGWGTRTPTWSEASQGLGGGRRISSLRRSPCSVCAGV